MNLTSDDWIYMSLAAIVVIDILVILRMAFALSDLAYEMQAQRYEDRVRQAFADAKREYDTAAKLDD